MKYAVRLNPLADDDLYSLHRWIRSEAGDEIADAYIRRVQARIATLADFPERGARRANLPAGIRALSFERRLLIIYSVDGKEVEVMRVISTARDIEPLFDA